MFRLYFGDLRAEVIRKRNVPGSRFAVQMRMAIKSENFPGGTLTAPPIPSRSSVPGLRFAILAFYKQPNS